MRDVLENGQEVFAIGAFRSGSQAKRELRIEVRHDLLISVSCAMVALINDQVPKIIRRESAYVLHNALNAPANNVCVSFAVAFHVSANRHFRPQFLETIVCLENQFFCMREKKRALS